MTRSDSESAYGPSPKMTFGVAVVPNVNSSSAAELQIDILPTDISFGLDWGSAFSFHETSNASGRRKTGFLYVPTFDDSDCDPDNIGEQANVTRVANLPAGYNLIALAPMHEVSCSDKWMDKASQDGADTLIFYDTSDFNSTSLSFDYQTGIGEGTSLIDDIGSFSLSVYYVPGRVGSELLEQLEAYSGNLTGVPHGAELATYYDYRDYVRVVVEIQSVTRHHGTGLWVYVVVAVAILLLVLATTSLAVHLFQARNRRNLRRRMENGEIDLESLGIKRLTVPRAILDSLPIRLYVPATGDSDADQQQEEAAVTAKLQEDVMTLTTTTVAGFNQHSCPICLEDFEPNEALVRQLPCRHVYHVACIDDFLEHHSSLCPLCKQSALPKGYIPPTLRITNATVRRERRMRRARERGMMMDEDDEYYNGDRRHGGGRRLLARPRWLSSGQAHHRRWRRVAPENNGDDDNLELRELARQSTAAAIEPNRIMSPYTDAEEDDDGDETQHRRGRRPTIVQRTRRPARNEPGAVVAADGSVFVVEPGEEDEGLQSGRMKRILRLVFPYMY
ncbi:hypothetical protein BZA70DRAFT_279340 [Myxozyma melibiosi]|uniref:RING-type domain-containing protein n=1 Tax=Myxozyma melibiosi TaxID=54550 RepID=A0ABR1F5X6_9ASCO